MPIVVVISFSQLQKNIFGIIWLLFFKLLRSSIRLVVNHTMYIISYSYDIVRSYIIV